MPPASSQAERPALRGAVTCGLGDALRRSFSVDVLQCPKCHGRLRMIAVITVTSGVGGSHYQRHHRYPGTRPLARRRYFTVPHEYGWSARRGRQLRDGPTPPR